MGYDDFYDESKGPYWSLESMTNTEKITYIGLNVWHVINFVAIGIVIYRIIKLVKSRRWQQRTM
jgi:large-conductance mechanosensitive channel